LPGLGPGGRTEQEDRRLADELLRDPKERAEHLMLVDLGRNDLGRVAEVGTVQVTDLMVVERYSHVMHLVSNIRCDLKSGADAWDLLQATFPAGTLSGAPKVRAMEIIAELEKERADLTGEPSGTCRSRETWTWPSPFGRPAFKGIDWWFRQGPGLWPIRIRKRNGWKPISKAMAIQKALQLIYQG